MTIQHCGQCFKYFTLPTQLSSILILKIMSLVENFSIIFLNSAREKNREPKIFNIISCSWIIIRRISSNRIIFNHLLHNPPINKLIW